MTIFKAKSPNNKNTFKKQEYIHKLLKTTKDFVSNGFHGISNLFQSLIFVDSTTLDKEKKDSVAAIRELQKQINYLKNKVESLEHSSHIAVSSNPVLVPKNSSNSLSTLISLENQKKNPLAAGAPADSKREKRALLFNANDLQTANVKLAKCSTQGDNINDSSHMQKQPMCMGAMTVESATAATKKSSLLFSEKDLQAIKLKSKSKTAEEKQVCLLKVKT